MYHFSSQMTEARDGHHRRDVLRRQGELVDRLCIITKELRNMKESRPKKIEWIQNYVSDLKHGLAVFPPLPLPLDPGVNITGVISHRVMMFKSNLMPLRLSFQRAESASTEYSLIFKLGDDLRQDQLILQVIHLMDKLLLKENLDLKLMPYKYDRLLTIDDA
jgi:phosphatidylinositol 3-kinase